MKSRMSLGLVKSLRSLESLPPEDDEAAAAAAAAEAEAAAAAGTATPPEDTPATPEPEVTEDTIAPNESETVAAALGEIDEAETDLDAVSSEMGEAEQVTQELDTLEGKVEAKNETGGMDEDYADLVEDSLESLCRRVGIKRSELNLPSVESFADVNTRVDLGKRSLEAIAEVKNGVIASLVEALRQSIEWVFNFFKNIFVGAKRTQEQAQDLLKNLKLVKVEGTEKELAPSSLYAKVLIGDKPGADTSILQLAGIGEKIYTYQKEVVKAFEDYNAGEKIPTIDPTKYGLVAAEKEQAHAIGAEDNQSVWVLPVFPGNKVVYLTTAAANTEETSQQALAGAIAMKAGAINLSESADALPLPVLSLANIEKIAEAIVGLTQKVLDYQDQISFVGNAKKRFVGLLEKSVAQTDALEDDQKASKEYMRATGISYRKLVDEPANSFSSNAVRSARDMLQWAQLSARVHGAKSAEEGTAEDTPAKTEPEKTPDPKAE